MKKNITITLMTLITLSITSTSFAISGNLFVEYMKEHEKLENGRNYNSTLESRYFYYISGVVDSMSKSFMLCEDIKTLGQAVAIVTKYLKENPKEWSKDSYNLVFNALIPKGGGYKCLSNNTLTAKGFLVTMDKSIIMLEIERRQKAGIWTK